MLLTERNLRNIIRSIIAETKWAKGYGEDTFDELEDQRTAEYLKWEAEKERRRNLKPTFQKSVEFDFKPKSDSSNYYDENAFDQTDWVQPKKNPDFETDNYGQSLDMDDLDPDKYKGRSLNSSGYANMMGTECWESINGGMIPSEGEECSNEVGDFVFLDNRWNIYTYEPMPIRKPYQSYSKHRAPGRKKRK
jgi:hypothetical protein